MTCLFAVLRVAFGLIFIGASVSKIMYPALFAQIIINYQLLPDMAVNPLALFLPWFELVCGVALVTNTFVRGASAALSLLLLVFLAALWFNVSRGLDVSCGCFTVNPDAQGGMIESAVRDTAIFALGLVVMARAFIDAGRRRASAQLWRDLKAPPRPRGRAGLAVDVPAPTVKDGVLVVGMASEGGSDESGTEYGVGGEAAADAERAGAVDSGAEAVADAPEGPGASDDDAGEAEAPAEAIELGPVQEAGADDARTGEAEEEEQAVPEAEQDGIESPVPLPGDATDAESGDAGESSEFSFEKPDADKEFAFDVEEEDKTPKP